MHTVFDIRISDNPLFGTGMHAEVEPSTMPVGASARKPSRTAKEEEALWEDIFSITSEPMSEAETVVKGVTVGSTVQPKPHCKTTAQHLAASTAQRLHCAVGTPCAQTACSGTSVEHGTTVRKVSVSSKVTVAQVPS